MIKGHTKFTRLQRGPLVREKVVTIDTLVKKEREDGGGGGGCGCSGSGVGGGRGVPRSSFEKQSCPSG